MQSFRLWTYKYGEVEDYSVNIVNESNTTKITKTTGKKCFKVSFEGNSKAT
jgi:hypothetical protein